MERKDQRIFDNISFLVMKNEREKKVCWKENIPIGNLHDKISRSDWYDISETTS